MPSSIYDNDSGSISFSTELSPTDGYFLERSHPQDLYIDAASSYDISTFKARETGTETETTRGIPAPSRPPYTRYTTPSSAFSDETMPLIDTRQPPPAYVDATANLYEGYNSVQQEGLGSGVGGPRWLVTFSRNGPPQHMTGTPDDGEEVYRITTYRRSRRRPREFCCSSGIMIKITLVICAIAISAWLVAAATRRRGSKQHNGHGEDRNPDIPGVEFPKWPSHCNRNYRIKSTSFDFGAPTSLRIHELVTEKHDDIFRSIFGSVHIAKAPADQTTDIQAKLLFATPSSIEISEIKYTKTDTSLSVRDPIIKTSSGARHRSTSCLGIGLILFVSPGVMLENLVLTSNHLGTKIHPNLSLTITNQTTITLSSGSLSSSSFLSRKTTIDIISGSVSGTYTLLDLLSIKTKFGSISVAVEPRKAEKEHPRPAVFFAGSVSGSVNVEFERFDIPERDYNTTVDATMGSVTGNFIHGSATELKTQSGSITADILPYDADAGPSTLRTFTRSGMTAVEVLAPYTNRGTPMKRLTSEHRGNSGSIKLTYPQEWEGTIEGGTMSGSLVLRGRDVEIIHQGGRGPLQRSVKARKGKGGSNLEFQTGSGSCDVSIGRI
ncbi:hypothetical protein K432DRAFT_427207 [Lepidopterella palustris CBS 459.81]|uniref:Adhesin domain-containing protein n=1 Tax=Lepidopterella palustris CBS 459.81 TaxID=1314670 RepID=A0A8E2E701_9PEZI|nr:hypothetical protein K432DRAFT_427207 [Lepidopterella palustris CBS 459.81]